MTWAAPPTFVAGTVCTAGNLNILSGDITLLGGTTSNFVTTLESTASTAYVNLTTNGPAVTLTTGTTALVILTCSGSNATAGDGYSMSFAITGGAPASAGLAVAGTSFTAGLGTANSAIIPLTALTPGVHTFTAMYAAVTGGTASFQNRRIAVIPGP